MLAMRTLPAGRHGRKRDRSEGGRARPRRVSPTTKRVVVGEEARTIKRWQLTRRRRRRIAGGREEARQVMPPWRRPWSISCCSSSSSSLCVCVCVGCVMFELVVCFHFPLSITSPPLPRQSCLCLPVFSIPTPALLHFHCGTHPLLGVLVHAQLVLLLLRLSGSFGSPRQDWTDASVGDGEAASSWGQNHDAHTHKPCPGTTHALTLPPFIDSHHRRFVQKRLEDGTGLCDDEVKEARSPSSAARGPAVASLLPLKPKTNDNGDLHRALHARAHPLACPLCSTACHEARWQRRREQSAGGWERGTDVPSPRCVRCCPSPSRRPYHVCLASRMRTASLSLGVFGQVGGVGKSSFMRRGRGERG